VQTGRTRASDAPDTAVTPSIRWRAVGAVAAFAAGLRVVWVLFASRAPRGLADPVIYLHSADSIANGGGYTSLLGEPTAYYPPGYPYFLGAVQWALDLIGQGAHLVMVVGLLQALLGGVAAGALVVAGDLLLPARPVTDGGPALRRPGGVFVGLLLACWPNLVLHTPLVLSESLFVAGVCVLTATLFLWTRHTIDGGGSRVGVLAVLTVVSTALCTWVRPQSVLLVLPAAALAWLLGGLGWRRTLRGAAWVALGVLVAVLPWTLRNAVVMDAFVPMSTNTGDNLCIGYHTGATGGFRLTDDCATEGRYVDGPAVEVARDAELRDRTISWILEHPAQVPALALRKLGATFAHDTDAIAAWESYGADTHLGDGMRTTLRWVSDLYYWAVGVASLVGVAFVVAEALRRRRERPWPTTPTLAVLTVAWWCTGWIVPVLFFGDERFKIPMVPAACLLAAVAVDRLVARWAHGDADTSADSAGRVSP
jgi:hypothetical protein